MRVLATFSKTAIVAAALAIAPAAFAANAMVGGSAMMSSKDIIENATNSKDHTTLVAAVNAAGIVERLKGAGPFTVFAPLNSGFDALPAGTVDALLKPENKTRLANILNYHVVAGAMTSGDIAAKAKASHGTLVLNTIAGGMIVLEPDGHDGWHVVDEHGEKARITIANLFQSNGVIHVIDHVLMPN